MPDEPQPRARERALTPEERQLAHWMLEHGKPEARTFLPQLDRLRVLPWRCPCGYASINFRVESHVPPPPGMNILGDFVFGSGEQLSGIFIFENDGLLAGIEVYGCAGDVPKVLPKPEELRPFGSQ